MVMARRKAARVTARWRTTRILLNLAIVGVGAVTPALGQTGAAAIRPAYAGDCEVVVEPKALTTGAVVDLQLSFGYLPRQRVADPGAEIRFAVVTPLQNGDRLRVLVNGDVVAPDVEVQPRPPRREPVGTCPPDVDRERETSFTAQAYLANLVDTFAPGSIANYQNPGAGGQKTRQTFGTYFDARVAGSEKSRVQFWVYAETLYGVRSADVDCRSEVKPGLCDDSPTAKAKYILEHATSLEGFVSPRLEFLTLQKDTESPIRLHVTGRIGFIALEGTAKAFRFYEVGAGGYLLDGPFDGSYVDLGFGHNALLSKGAFDRVRIDGVIIFGLQRFLRTEAARFYVQMRIDGSLGEGPDAIQTIYGLSFDIRSLFGL